MDDAASHNPPSSVADEFSVLLAHTEQESDDDGDDEKVGTR
jgi:hypothetical protein